MVSVINHKHLTSYIHQTITDVIKVYTENAGVSDITFDGHDVDGNETEGTHFCHVAYDSLEDYACGGLRVYVGLKGTGIDAKR